MVTDVASLTFTSWNKIAGWLRRLQGLARLSGQSNSIAMVHFDFRRRFRRAEHRSI
jgi:hypothetical protein